MPEMPSQRLSAPRPEDDLVVDGSDGPRRDFRIRPGLRKGRGPQGRVFNVSEAMRTARAWMKRRRLRLLSESIGAAPSPNDCVIRLRYQFIDQRRRRLSLPEVRLDGGQRRFGKHEHGSTKLCGAGAAEGVSRKALEAGFEP
jgi:hypothetical protein